MVAVELLAGVEGRAEPGRGLAGFPGDLLEVIPQVGVLLGDDPVLDPGLGGELDDGQPAGGPPRRAGQETIGRGQDRPPLPVGLVLMPGRGRGARAGITRCGMTVDDFAEAGQFVAVDLRTVMAFAGDPWVIACCRPFQYYRRSTDQEVDRSSKQR